MELFTVCRHESGMYWYIWNNADNTQVCTADGESIREDGDYLYSMQVYPTVKPYDNYETEIEIKE